jgi:flagellar hook-associated protein 1 FlgK
MGLNQALATAASGLRVTQAGLTLIASNVANAETPGYVRKSLVQTATGGTGAGVSVQANAIQRELDTFVQRQLTTESGGGGYADTRAQYYQALQSIYGTPGATTALETVYGNFTSALENLTTSPESSAAQSQVLGSAQTLAQQLNSLSGSIQNLRSQAESGIADAVSQANDALSNIARINQQIGTVGTSDAAKASLLDQRDSYVSTLSQLMDIKVIPSGQDQIGVFTGSSTQLVGGAQASQITFDSSGALTAQDQWSSDPTKRSVGTLTLVSPNGSGIDLIASHAIKSGSIAALVDMRDNVLPEAQAQLDAFAGGIASALSDQATSGTPAAVGAQNGFDVDTSGLLAGNSLTVSFTDNTTNTQKTYSFVRVDAPNTLPLADTLTADPNDKVIGLDFSTGLASVVSQINAALGASGVQASNPSGTTLRFLDDGASDRVTIGAATTTKTTTTLGSGDTSLPFFVDGSSLYTGAQIAQKNQSVGFAGRISVNTALLSNPGSLVTYQAGTPSGDATRPNFLYGQLTSARYTYPAQSGVGTAAAPFTGSLSDFLRQTVSQQGQAAEAAQNLQQGQSVVVQALQQRLNETSGVNVDEEMANLLTLQNSYAANARVMTAVKDMVDTLMQI